MRLQKISSSSSSGGGGRGGGGGAGAAAAGGGEGGDPPEPLAASGLFTGCRCVAGAVTQGCSGDDAKGRLYRAACEASVEVQRDLGALNATFQATYKLTPEAAQEILMCEKVRLELRGVKKRNRLQKMKNDGFDYLEVKARLKGRTLSEKEEEGLREFYAARMRVEVRASHAVFVAGMHELLVPDPRKRNKAGGGAGETLGADGQPGAGKGKKKGRGFVWDDMFLTRKNFRDEPKEMLGMVPGEAPALDFGTCALIGSSGVLTGSNLGRAIDGHDAVLRLNQAPATEDFAEDVGSRVDFRLLNKRWGVAYGERKYRKLILNDPRNTTLIATRAGPGNFVKLRQSAKELGVQNEMLFMRPKAVRATQDALLFFRESLEVALGEQLASPNGRNSATTGLLGMFLLLEMCGSLDLYGFAFDSCDPACSSTATYHYFTRKNYAEALRSSAHPSHSYLVEGSLMRAAHAVGLACIHPQPEGFPCGEGVPPGW